MTGSALSQMIADFTGLTGIPVPVYGATLNLTAYVMSIFASLTMAVSTDPVSPCPLQRFG